MRTTRSITHPRARWRRKPYTLADRLSYYRRQVRDGVHPDLKAAVKANTVLHRLDRAEDRYLAHTNLNRPLGRRKDAHRRKQLRRIVCDGRPCAYCGTPDPWTVDHIHPRSRGGSDRIRNLVPACMRCNREKANRTVAEWRRWRERRNLAWPPGSKLTQHSGPIREQAVAA
ncbi:HNH endonuclease [Streptomyces scabiei]|uniref:HNH endonuclease n=1 Tax=Streptomyces scabiei TaxID=1930 RepID=UPI0034013D36